MKKIFIALFLITCVFACKNEDLDPRPDLNDSVGAVTLVSNQSTAAFDLSILDTETISFTIDVDGFDITGIESVSVQLIYTDKERLPNPDPDGSKLDSVHSAVELQVLTSFPANVNFTASQLATAAGFTTTDSLFIGDNFNFIFPISTTDGRTLTTALNSDLCLQPAQPSFGGCNVSVNIACPFVVADAVGAWEVVTDEWGDWAAGETINVVSNAAGDGLILEGIFSKFRNNANGPYDVEVLVNQTSGLITVAQQEAWDCAWYGCAFGIGSVAGSGVVFSCIGSMTLDLEHTVAAGTFGVNQLVLTLP